MKEIIERRLIARGYGVKAEFDGEVYQPTGLQAGDIFTIPTDYRVYEICHSFISIQHTIVQTEDGDIRFLYPSQLVRRVKSCTLDGEPGPVVCAGGSVVEEYKKHQFVDDGFKAISGKRIKVTNATKVLVSSERGFIYRTVYQFDFV